MLALLQTSLCLINKIDLVHWEQLSWDDINPEANLLLQQKCIRVILQLLLRVSVNPFSKWDFNAHILQYAP